MFVPSMTYEEIYREICNDSRDLFADIIGEKPRFQQLAKRARKYPYGRIYLWKHPKSHNQYTYFFSVNRHSEWDKTPRLIIFTEYESKKDEICTVAVSRDPNENIRISIFRPHFFDRYYERILSQAAKYTPETKREIKIAFLSRTSSTISLGGKMASRREQENEDPDLENDSLLTIEGLIETKIVKANPNIVLFKTYLTIQDLFEPQYEEVTFNAIHIFYLRAINDSPRFQKSIDKLYLVGINELNRLWQDPKLPFEEKQQLRMKKYQEVIEELSKYII